MARKKVKRWEDHRITGIGRREARTAFYKDSQKKISLNGEWDFKYVDAPELSPEGFEQPVGMNLKESKHRCTRLMFRPYGNLEGMTRCITQMCYIHFR